MSTCPTPEHAKILSAEARTRQRDQAASELVRALLLLNGGGAGALLLFLQAIWASEKALAYTTVSTLVCFAAGAFFAALFHLFRYKASVHHQSGDQKRYEKFARFYMIAAGFSLGAFAVGVVVLATGALNALAR